MVSGRAVCSRHRAAVTGRHGCICPNGLFARVLSIGGETMSANSDGSSDRIHFVLESWS